MLIDKYLPRFDFVERHSRQVQAGAPELMQSILSYEADKDPVFRVLTDMREAPARLIRRWTTPDAPSPPRFGVHNFTLLEKGEREIVYGQAGEFWKPGFGQRKIADRDAFLAFDEPGVPKLALNFLIADESGGRKLSTETRIFCPDADARRRFAPYWYLIRPFSGLIRLRILKIMDRESREIS